MPTYQYACTECGQQTEAVQSFSDAPLTECPACGGKLRKVFSAVGVVFKGSGFYKTDSRGSSSSSEGKGESSTPAKTESKPDAKPAAAAKESSSTTKSAPAATSA